jgi:hypothetical protein
MRETFTHQLPQTIRRGLDRAANEDFISRNDVHRQSLANFLFVLPFRQVRRRMTAAA